MSPDFIHVAKRLVALKREKCGDCDFVNMGTYATRGTFTAMANQVRAGAMATLYIVIVTNQVRAGAMATLYIVIVMAFEIVGILMQ